MSLSLKRYSKYGYSGIKCLGSIPGHWRTQRIRNLAELRVSNVDKHSRKGELPVRLCNYVQVYRHERITNDLAFMKGTADAREIERFRLKIGDVIITKDSEEWTDIGVPAIVESTAGDLVCGYHLAVLRPYSQCVDSEFLFRAIQNVGTSYQFHVRANGVTRYGLSHDAIKSAWLAVPPMDEQLGIGRFINHSDRRLQKLIRAKRRVIALLEEQKQSIIQTLVTRGINDVVPRRSSKPGWVDEIPQHWQSLRARYLFREVDVRSATGRETHLSMSQKRGLIPSEQIEQHRLISQSYVGAKLCRNGDLVLNRLKAHLGVFALARQEGLVSPDYTVLRPIAEIRSDYFELVLRTPACRVELRRRAKGIVEGFWRLYTDDFYDIRLPVPPTSEQVAIVETAKAQTAALTSAIDRSVREIELIHEYRTRLIADMVTGKLDVRGVELPELEDAGQSERLIETDEEDALGEGELVGAKESDDAGD